MAQTIASFDAGHGDTVHDVQLDYYGRRLATASSDRCVKVFDIVGDQVSHVADLLGHEGPVWQVAWGHPKFGNLIASASFDHRVIIWKEGPDGSWSQAYCSAAHTASVNALSFAPHELGLALAAASSDGSISVLTHTPESGWHTEKIEGAHPLGALGVSWAPAVPRGSLTSGKAPGPPVRRFVSGGADNLVKVWFFNDAGRRWEQEPHVLSGHSDWVRDVAWAPNLGLPLNTIASGSQDGTVMIWNEKPDGQWQAQLLHDFQAPVWRISWSVTGGLLSVSDAKASVSVWKQSDGKWQQVVE
eukprot:CAMPEP_0206143770 /NCGR_PEP_ID=MMETSP1473-20131121/21740_1 /ASSEMBLY_ACC=CAM_ASM_001109 /TAXON_ID=1461547 /ORGANISM="Stichococcus sp, Strain RCC1054" /LENGTH=300 /DNA_ID=CAMNT_0053539321 /DNA_START=217 /DNA_END=1119 /DNA_ORIENTATION=+